MSETSANSGAAGLPVQPIPAVLTAADIGRILQVSRPTAYAVLHACRPFAIGRVQRVLGEDFVIYLRRLQAGGATLDVTP